MTAAETIVLLLGVAKEHKLKKSCSFFFPDIIDGTSLTLTHASKPSSSSASSPPPPPAALSPAAAAALTGRAPAVTTEVGTDSMFFICFGVNESCNSLHSSVEDAAEKRRPSNAASTTSMETSSSSNGKEE